MANSTLQVTYRTKKTGTGTQDLNKELKTSKLSLTDLKSGLDLAVGGFRTVQAAVQSVIDPTVEYAGQVRTLGRTIGASAEESSKLIQAADDVGVSVDTLQGALEAAIKRGVEPTIEGIGKLADEYNAIEDPIARTKFLMDKFGKSGADLAPLMEQGADGIAAAGEEAERLGLVLSEEGVQSAREYEIAVDNLEDALNGLKITIGQKVIPIITDLFTSMADGIQLQAALNAAADDGVITQEEAAIVWQKVRMGVIDAGDALADLTTKVETHRAKLEEVDPFVQNLRQSNEDAAVATEAFSNQIQSQTQWLNDLAGPAREVKDSVDELANANLRLSAALGGEVSREMASYEESQADIEAQIAETRAELEKYTRMSGQTVTVVTDTEEAQRNLTIAMAAQEAAAGKLADAQQKLSENTDPDKQLQLEAAVARAQGAFNSAAGEVGEWNSTLASSGGTYVTDYSTKIDEATGKLGELEQAAADNAAAHEDATERILFGYLQQALAVDGLTLDEIHALTSVGEQWGILDSDTANAVDGILDAAEDLAKGGDLATFQNQVNGVRDAILGVPTDINVTFHVNQTGQMPSYTPNGGNSNAFAEGGDFIVPPGYPNDSYPMRVQSGERVVVIPPGEPGNGGGGGPTGDTFYVTINAAGANAQGVADLLNKDDIRRRTGARRS